MNGKPVLQRKNAQTIITLKSRKFQEKLLCDGITLNPGDACAFSCCFCYVEGQMMKVDKPTLVSFNDERNARGEKEVNFNEVVIRRPDSVELLRNQLFDRKGALKYSDPNDDRVVYGSTLVDVAANMELLKETARLCNMILENTGWQIRLLSKGALLHLLFKNNLIASKYRHRMILGFSTGTLDNRLAGTIEVGTAKVSKRLEALHWLQDEGYRTFGMVCPNLPEPDGNYDKFSDNICEAIRVDRCEHVWAEVINLRGKSLARTLAALHKAGLVREAEALSAVMGTNSSGAWEKYARDTFLAHRKNVPANKLRFLQYVTQDSVGWWSKKRKAGAVLLGKVAEEQGLLAVS